MTLKNVTSRTQLLSDGARFIAVEAGQVVTVTVETGLRLLLQPHEWAYAADDAR
jgi:hypothetical protein